MTATVTVDVLRFVGERLGSGAHGTPPSSRAERRRRQQAARRQERAAGSAAPLLAWRVWPLVACAAALALVLLYRQGIGADRQEEAGDDVMTYTWRDSPFLPGAANRLVRALFWSPSSDSTHPPNAITYYLQHETLSAPTIDTFVQVMLFHQGEWAVRYEITCPLTDIAVAREATRSFLGSLRARE